MNDEKLREIYRNEGWGVLAEAAGFDPVNTESSARSAFRFAHQVIADKDATIARHYEAMRFAMENWPADDKATSAAFGALSACVPGGAGCAKPWAQSAPIVCFVGRNEIR